MKLANSVFLRLAAIAAMIATLSAGALGCTAQNESVDEQPLASTTPVSAAPSNNAPSVAAVDPSTTQDGALEVTVEVKSGELLYRKPDRNKPGVFGQALSAQGLASEDWTVVAEDPRNKEVIGPPSCTINVPYEGMQNAVLGKLSDAGVPDGGVLRGNATFPGSCIGGTYVVYAAKSGPVSIPTPRRVLEAQLNAANGGLANLGKQVASMNTQQSTTIATIAQMNANIERLAADMRAQAKADADRRSTTVAIMLLGLAALVVLGVIYKVWQKKHSKHKASNDAAVSMKEITKLVNEAVDSIFDKRPSSEDLFTAIDNAADRAAERVAGAIRISDFTTHAAQTAALALKPTLDANTAALDAGRRREEALAAALAQTQASMRELATSIDHAAQLNADLNHQQDDLNADARAVKARERAVKEREDACAAREARPTIITSHVPTLCPPASPADDAAVSAAAQTFNGIGPTAPLPAITEDDADDRTQVRAALPLTGADDADPPTLGAEGVASANTASEPAADHDGNGSNGTVHAIEDAATVDNTGSSEGTSHVRPANGRSGNGHAASRKVSRETLEVTIGVGTDGIGFVCLCCRRDLADDNACEEHKKLKHYQCLACHNAPIVVDFEPWMEHLKDFHPGSNGDQDNDVVVGGTSMPPPAANPSADYEGAVALAT